VTNSLFNLKTTISILPIGYKIRGARNLTLSTDEKSRLWHSTLKFAQSYTNQSQENICGYQDAPSKGTVLSAVWDEFDKPKTALLTSEMISSTYSALTFDGKWSLLNITDVSALTNTLSVPKKFTFGLEIYAPRRRFLFGVAPTMTEQGTIAVDGDNCTATVFGRALQTPILSKITAFEPFELASAFSR
jgi:hypothetical protein